MKHVLQCWLDVEWCAAVQCVGLRWTRCRRRISVTRHVLPAPCAARCVAFHSLKQYAYSTRIQRGGRVTAVRASCPAHRALPSTSPLLMARTWSKRRVEHLGDTVPRIFGPDSFGLHSGKHLSHFWPSCQPARNSNVLTGHSSSFIHEYIRRWSIFKCYHIQSLPNKLTMSLSKTCWAQHETPKIARRGRHTTSLISKAEHSSSHLHLQWTRSRQASERWSARHSWMRTQALCLIASLLALTAQESKPQS